MGVKQIDHIAINARNISASKKFYCELIGLKEDKSVDMGELILHYLLTENGSKIELFEFKDPSFYDTLTTHENAIKHIAFEVDDVESVNAVLKNADIEFELEMCVLEQLQVKTLICKDPDGVLVEISQY